MADSTCILTQGILYFEINHLRKAEPIQLYQILNKGKTLKNPNMHFSLFSSHLKPKLKEANINGFFLLFYHDFVCCVYFSRRFE